MSQKLKGEGRVISVLSDGLGSGIKACVLSTMTATMAIALIWGVFLKLKKKAVGIPLLPAILAANNY